VVNIADSDSEPFEAFPLAQTMSERKEAIQVSVFDFQSPHIWSCEAEGYISGHHGRLLPTGSRIKSELKLMDTPIWPGSRLNVLNKGSR